MAVLLLAEGTRADAMYFYGGSKDEQAFAMSPTNDGGVYLTGYITASIPYVCDMWTIRVNATGTIMWQDTISNVSNNNVGNAIDTTADDGCIVAWHCGSYACVTLYSSAGNMLGHNVLSAMSAAYAVKTLKMSIGYVVVGRYSQQANVVLLTSSLDILSSYYYVEYGIYIGVMEMYDGYLAVVGRSSNEAFGLYTIYEENMPYRTIFSMTQSYGCCNAYMITGLTLSDWNVLLVGVTNSVDGIHYYLWVKKRYYWGAEFWSNVYGSNSTDYRPTAAEELPDDTIAITGDVTMGSPEELKTFFIRLSSEGNIISNTTFDLAGSNSGTGIHYRAVDSTIIISGYANTSDDGFQYYVNMSILCLLGQYLDAGVCNYCPVECRTCTSLENCQSCWIPYYILNDPATGNGKCVIVCPNSYYASGWTCQPCEVGCKTCIDQDNCTVCSSMMLYNYTDSKGALHCASTCPESYRISGMNCIPCATGCRLCSPQGDCQGCLPDYFEYQSPNSRSTSKQCMNPCPAGYYGDTYSGLCRHCHPYCLTCSAGPDSDQCDSCNLALAYPLEDLNSTCVTDCQPLGYYRLGQVCKRIISSTKIGCRLRLQLLEVLRPWAREVHRMWVHRLPPQREV